MSRTQKMATPYFREWSNMRFHKGKSFLAPPRLFKADKALYFPNLHGQTLTKRKELSDTTPVLEGNVSVVSVFSSAWAEGQVATFVAEKSNPELNKIVKESKGLAQMVHINVEENALKAMLIKLFMPSLRKRMGEANWGRYFVVRRGLTDEIREAIGLLNSKVGYVYLLDGKCRIRWAGSGICEGDEKDGLVKGLRRLVEEARERKGEKYYVETSRRVIPGNGPRKSSVGQVAATTV
jgi:mitochondrial ATPase complex subunit ATP10